MGKTYTIIKTQYIYVNSATRDIDADKSPSHFSISLPHGLFHCDEPTLIFKITLQDFAMGIDWYYINTSNNSFSLGSGLGTTMVYRTVTMPVGNYTFKQVATLLTTAITTAMGPGSAQVSWSSSLNKYIFQFLDGFNYTLIPGNAYTWLGFTNPNGMYTSDSSKKIMSEVVLKSNLCNTICMTIDNVTPSKEATNVSNKDTEECVPCANVLSIPNNYSPFDMVTFINQNDLFAMYINEKYLDQLEFTMRDENGDEMTYASDWRGSFKIETLLVEETAANDDQLIEVMREIRDYLRYIFVGHHMGPQVHGGQNFSL